MTAPTLPAHPEARDVEARWFEWVGTIDHKRIGLLYLGTALFFFVVGGCEALVMRLQLWAPRATLLSPEAFDQLFTMHGTTMIFLVVMPALTGFANYLVPLMIGARDVAFPRLNALGYWLFPFGGLLLHFSWIAGGAPDVGWFSYAPLSETPFTGVAPGADYWAIALLVLGVSSVASSINLIATIASLRATGVTMRRLPLFVWMVFVNSFLTIFALPALSVSCVMLLTDRIFAAQQFLPSAGGSAILWQHYFWGFGHPEVYIMVLPAFGIVSEVLPVFSRKPIFGYAFVATSTVAIAVLSFGVWAHHMFAVGLGHASDAVFAGASFLIAVPTGVKIFNWVATLWGGSIQLTTALLFAVAFLVQFTIGGLSGVTFAAAPIDWQTTDTYYVVAHFHYVLFGGTAFGILAGLYYWFPKMTGRRLDERLGRLHFWMTVVGFNLTFFVQHVLGLLGMPRRVYTYPDWPWWGTLNALSTVGAFVLGASVLVLAVNLARSARSGRPAGPNPWNAWTLEWAAASPPPEENFEVVPPVRSRRPLWDLACPQSPDAVVGEDEPPHPRRPEAAPVAVLSFIGSESAFFALLLVAFVFFTASDPALAASGAARLDRVRTGIFSILLVGSSFTLWRAEKALERGQGRALTWLAATLALGVAFLANQVVEYLGLARAGVGLGTNLFATTFFTVTGFHGLHVTVGLVALAIVLGLLIESREAPRARWLRNVGYYWHFVDAVWIAVFSIVYLWGGR